MARRPLQHLCPRQRSRETRALKQPERKERRHHASEKDVYPSMISKINGFTAAAPCPFGSRGFGKIQQGISCPLRNTSRRPSAHTLISDSTPCGRSMRILGRAIGGGGAWKVQ